MVAVGRVLTFPVFSDHKLQTSEIPRYKVFIHGTVYYNIKAPPHTVPVVVSVVVLDVSKPLLHPQLYIV